MSKHRDCLLDCN